MSKSKKISSGTQSVIAMIAGSKILERPTHSESFLIKQKTLIEKMIREAEIDLNFYLDSISDKSGHGTSDTSTHDVKIEDADISQSKYLNLSLAKRKSRHIENLKNAKLRIQNKTYGVCRITGKLIDKNRLKLVPHATLSMEAKLLRDR